MKTAWTNIRSTSGVCPVPIYTMPWPCGGNCSYCPQAQGIPRSYVPNPDTVFASKAEFDPGKQLERHLRSIRDKVAKPCKTEIILLGGSFSFLPEEYRRQFIKGVYDTLNGEFSKDIEESVQRQNKAQWRCVGITVESRPDQIDEAECRFLLGLGITKVELGVQSLNRFVLDRVNRGHTPDNVKSATSLLRRFGFKVGFHIMLGLPGSSPLHDLRTIHEVFDDPSLSPDFLKIYPCVLFKNSNWQPSLWRAYRQSLWIPYDNETATKLVYEIERAAPRYVRISRIQRQFSANWIAAGPVLVLRSHHDMNCACIRCREVGYHIEAQEAAASELRWNLKAQWQGRGIFLEATMEQDNNVLLGLARLSKGISNVAYLRELKVFGPTVPVGKQGLIQHKGIGYSLLKCSEKLAKETLYCHTLRVLTGVGVRTYFENLGYSLYDNYMEKELPILFG